MAKLIALYGKPADPKHFDDYYRNTHTPLARAIPGLKAFDVSRGTIANPIGPSRYHKVAVLEFESMEALQAGLAAPEGQRAAADIGNFADGGAELLIFDDQPA